ncbi:unnamed protein product [Calypogeia fissa]
MAIQTTLASIKAPEVHAAIQKHDREAVSRSTDEVPGQCLLLLLGIEAWFSVFMAAAKSSTQVALDLVQNFSLLLEGIEGTDLLELEQGIA